MKALSFSVRANRANGGGSVLIIVLWVAFGLVSLTLYFAHAMSLEMRATDNRLAALKSEQAIEGAARYVSNILSNLEAPGVAPDVQSYRTEAVPVGEAMFWLIGRPGDEVAFNQPFFGLVDEASRLNLNTATLEMLEMLPNMTAEFAAAIIDWRNTDDEITAGGAGMETYLRLSPSYLCKNAPFESIEELRLVYGADMELLYGDDANWNGVLDFNERSGNDNVSGFGGGFGGRTGLTAPGILEFVTVHSREPNRRSDGSARVNLNGSNQQELALLLQEYLDADRANEILAGIGSGRQFTSILDFYIESGMTPEEFDGLSGEITVTEGDFIEGLINVNTASAEVLACIPGIGAEGAQGLVTHRQSRAGTMHALAWVTEVLDPENIREAGPFLTGRGYQFTADVAALGPHGRGYRRVKFIYDSSEGDPRIVYRRDLSHLGWALGPRVREEWLLLNGR